VRVAVSPDSCALRFAPASRPSLSLSPLAGGRPLRDAVRCRGSSTLSPSLEGSGGTRRRAPRRRLSLGDAAAFQRGSRERRASAAGVRRAAARRRRHATAGGTAGRRDVCLHRPPIRFRRYHLFGTFRATLWHFIEHMACGLVVFPDPDDRRSTGVRKPENSIMEGFKRAFAAPWPKTLRYQVTEGTLKDFEILDILDSSNWLRIFGAHFIVK
jgi:hypothetical protein